VRSKRLIAGRGLGGTYTLPEHIEADAEDFGGESETLRPGTSFSWAKNSKRTHTERGPTRVSVRGWSRASLVFSSELKQSSPVL
jgi:hypothetical protein